MAIKDLLISNNLLKSTNFGLRKKYMKLVEDVKNQGAKVFIFNVEHPSG